jgi:hypothetical protein
MELTPYPQYKTQKELPKNYWEEKQKELKYAYVWYSKYSQEGYTSYEKVDFGGGAFDEISPDIIPFNLVKIELFPFNWEDKNGRDKHLKKFSEFRNLLNKYFYNTLAFYPYEKQRGFLDFNYTVLIAPKETIDEIENTIKEYKLSKFNDFVFYLIATIQKLYIDKIEYYQGKQQQKEIKKFPDEIKKLFRVIEKANEREWHKELKNKKPSRLEKITFSFDNEKTITITDEVLLLDIISGIVQREGRIINPHEKEDVAQWKANTQNLPKTLYSPQQEKNKFKHNIAKALHEFLTKQSKLKSTDSWELIAYFMKFYKY